MLISGSIRASGSPFLVVTTQMFAGQAIFAQLASSQPWEFSLMAPLQEVLLDYTYLTNSLPSPSPSTALLFILFTCTLLIAWFKHDNVSSSWQRPLAHKKYLLDRASLVVQWLRICRPMQGTGVRALVREDPTCHGATMPVRHNYWACALEPASHNYWARVPHLLKPARLEPVLRNKTSHRNEEPVHCNEE